MRGFFRSSSSTKRSRLARVTVGLVVAAGIIPVTAGSGQAITGAVDSSSYGLKTNVSLLALPVANIAGTPVAAYPAGPASGNVASLNVVNAASTGAVGVTATGDPLADTAAASSSVAGLDLLGGTAVAVGASGVVGSTCVSDGTVAGTTATATTTGLSIPGAGTLPDNPAPNTRIDIKVLNITLANVYLNEQAVSLSGGVRTITVNALRLKLLGGVLGAVGTGDIIAGHSECSATVPSVPSVSSITPVQGPQVGGTLVTIDGTNFLGATQVLIDGFSAPFTRVSTTRLTATTPAHAVGATKVQVSTGAGTSTLASGPTYTYLATPTVTAVSPATGPAAGGTTVTLTGTGFTGATAVTFDGTPATSYTVVSPTSITATAPAGTGTDFVQVTAPGGVSPTGASNAYTYLSVPTLTSISPTSGLTSGGTLVTLTGTGFTPTSKVRVDGVLQADTSVTYVSDTTLRVTTPAHAVGSVPIVVTTAGGTTASRPFVYQAVPTGLSLSPTSGTVLGGQVITISGTAGLDSVTAVTIGTETLTSIANQSATSLQVTTTTSLRLPGVVNVTVTGPGSIVTPVGTYEYTLSLPPAPTAPVVNSLTPLHGAQSGGTSVQIQGSNFNSGNTATAVSFGGVPATSFTVDSDTQITAIAPPAASSGPVSVTVTSPAGTSAVNPIGGTYLYDPLTPGLTSLSPNHGPIGGGTVVTLTGTAFTPVSTVLLDNTVSVPATYVDATHLTVSMPPHAAGDVDVTVQTTGALSSGARTFTYDPPTTTTGVLAPASGTTAGGTPVVVSGSNLTPVTSVSVEGTTATITAKTATSLTFTTPAHAAGSAAVVLGGAGGLSVSAGTFLYVTPAPTVSGVSPNHGPLAGGNSVTITGTDLGSATAVTIGGNAATITATTGTTVTVTAPASTAVGATTLGVTGPGGSANATYTYDPAPVISGLNPDEGPDTGNTPVTITGTGFLGATGVNFGGVAGTSFVVVGDTQITVSTPAGSAGLVNVVVQGPNGPNAVTSASRFQYIDTHSVPTVGSISPVVGSTLGGTAVTLTGTGFLDATAVSFGATAGTGLTVVDDTTITVTSPAHAAGAVNVTVTDPNGTSTQTAGFTFVAPGSAPTVGTVSPVSGPAAGGTTVTISGIGLTGANGVSFGGTPATSFAVVNDTTITAVSPLHATGPVDITVTNPSGTSSTVAGDRFTFVAPAVVTSLTPTSGPQDGGITVTLTGTDFSGATGVLFGAVAGTDVSISGDTTLTVTSPAQSPGPVSVTVVGVGGTGAGSTFTYNPAPQITAVLSPTSGPTAGLTPVTVTGTGFLGATGVKFGTTSGTGVTVVNDTSITVFSPAHAAGQVDVTVTGPNGTSPVVAFDRFTYVPPAPTIAAGGLTPNRGPLAGGTSVTVTGTGFTGATGVAFGGVAGTNVAISSDTSLTVTSPAQGASGPVQVTVTGPGGTSAGQTFTYSPLPTVTVVSPNTGPAAGGTTVALTGSGFLGATVRFGGTTATTYTVNSDTSITVTSPPGSGTVDITVLGPNGTSLATASDRFTYAVPPTPVIGSMTPTSGPAGGGTGVTITGSGFTSATAVNFGATAGTNVTISSDTSLSVTSPPGSGTAEVVVVGPATSSSTAGTANDFTYNAAPAITSVSATSGSVDGGATVTVTGTGFTGATAVKFGTDNGTILSNNGTVITVTSPAHAPGPVDVRVVTPSGTSAIVAGDRYTYVAPLPTVSGISPSTGPTTGGTTITVTGTGFTYATQVNFVTGTAVPTVISDTTLTVVSPAQAAGTVDVTVTSPGGTSGGGGTADDFTFQPGAPAVGAVSPAVGGTAGGTPVTITGSGFTGATGVSFGGVAATGFTVVNDTTITVNSPARTAGDAVVTVTGPGGTSTGGPVFTYVAPGTAPVIGSVSPDRGPVAGGTRVTISGVGFTGATAVLFDGVAGTDLVVVDDSTIQVTAPAGAGSNGGNAAVTVVGPNGSSAPRDTARFGYVPLSQLPTVTAITPEVGPVAGGTRLTIRGARFDEFTTVTFDGVPGTGLVLGPDVGAALRRPGVALAGTGFRAAYSNGLTIVSPAHAQGPVTVVVSNAAGSVSYVELFTFIPALTDSTLAIEVVADSRTRVEPRGEDYLGLKIGTCTDPTGAGSTRLATNTLSCIYSAPSAAGTDRFTMSVTDVLGQTATQTVTVTIIADDDDGGTDTGGDGGNENDGDEGNGDGNGGTGTGGTGGNENDGGSGTGSDGLAFTGMPFLLVPGLLGGLVLLLVGTGLVTGDRLRTVRGRTTVAAGPAGPAAGLAGMGLVPSGRATTGDDDPEPDARADPA